MKPVGRLRPTLPTCVVAAAMSGVLALATGPASVVSASSSNGSGGSSGSNSGHSSSKWRNDVSLGALSLLTESYGVNDVWNDRDASGRSLTGEGIDVAVIDTGVNPVAGLATPGKVIDGPDLSFESQFANLANRDTYGHGTHLAGIIAGRDADIAPGKERSTKRFVGVAPGARIVNVKVATHDGATDVSQVIAAIDWVVQHRNDNGMNIRVLNLAFGTDSVQPYQVDPLAFAVEQAWRHGIVVVVAAGNAGGGTARLVNPATDPFVIAVGASDHAGTAGRDDDSVAAFSQRGSAERGADLLAPGRSLVSLRVPGSAIDREFPGAVELDPMTGEPRFFRGSGTSQAAAFVSGTAALLLQKHPQLTPDQVKQLLVSSADAVDGADPAQAGRGLLDVEGAFDIAADVIGGPEKAAKHDDKETKRDRPAAAAAPHAGNPAWWQAQAWEPSTGLGSLEAARGSAHVVEPSTRAPLEGEQDIFGEPWDPATWTVASAAGNAWTGGVWRSHAWTGNAWTSNAWTSHAWTSHAWTGNAWTGNAWTSNAWTSNAWTGNAWTSNAWTGNAWTGNAWTSNAWTSNAWTSNAWTGNAWTGNAWTGNAWNGWSWR